MTASEIFESITGSGSSDFTLLVRILNARGRWCLIRGLAVNCYVEPVYTLDADIVVTAEEVPALKSELAEAGFSVQEFPHSLNAQMRGSDLRIQFTMDTRYQEFLADTSFKRVLGENVPVATIENIARGKIWAWQDEARRPTKRKKDELDLMRILESYPELRELMPVEIQVQVPQS